MEWKQFESVLVSEAGDVRSTDPLIHMRARIDSNGYVVYSFNGSTYQAHRLVAHLWLGLNLDDRSSQVDHMDDNRSHNHWRNLQIVTAGQNKKLATLRAYPNDVPGVSKTCRRCRVLKPVADFGIDRRRDDGRTPYCKPCTKHYAASKHSY